jgi:NADH dehydrogenase
MILVVGSTGTLGRKVTRTLLASGEDVRVMTRVIAKSDELKALGAKPVRGDLRDPESLEFALRGARAVVASAHSLLGRGDESSEKVDYDGHRNLIDAAKAAGVEHFVYTSVVGASRDHAVDFWRTKARIEDHLRDSGLTFTIVRPTSFMETHAYMLLGKYVLDGKRVLLFGSGKNKRNFVAAEDVAKAIVGALRIPSLRGETIDIGGPENLSAREVISVFEKVSGRKAKVSAVPMYLIRAMSLGSAPVHEGVSRILKLSVVNETTDQTFDPSMTRQKLPLSLIRLEDWVRNRINSAAKG